MARSALRSVSDAIEATRRFLLPASLRRIGTLALVVAFMGAPGTPLPTSPQLLDPTLWSSDWGGGSADGDSGAGGDSDGGGGDTSGTETPIGDLLGGDLGGAESTAALEPGTWPEWLLVVAAVVVGLAVAYVVVGVLMRFVLVEALGSGDVSVLAPAGRHLRKAAGVALFRLVLGAVAFGIVLGAAAAITPAGPGSIDGIGAYLLGLLVTVAVASAWLLDRLLVQFVVPTMVAIDGGVLAGTWRFGSALRAEPVEYVLFVVVRALLGIGVGIAAAIALGVVLAVAGLALGTIAAIVVVLGGGIGGLGPAGWAALLGLLGIFLLIGVVTAVLVAVPFQVYLWSYALLVLGDTDEALDVIPELRAAAREDSDGGIGIDPPR